MQDAKSRSGAVLRVMVSCTPQALPFAMCPRCNSSALYSLQHQQGQSGSRRQRRGRDGPPVCAAHEPLHTRKASATHGRGAKRTTYRGCGDGPSAALPCPPARAGTPPLQTAPPRVPGAARRAKRIACPASLRQRRRSAPEDVTSS